MQGKNFEILSVKHRSHLHLAMKKKYGQSQARITKIDRIIQRLYEDNIEGKISDERFYENDCCLRKWTEAAFRKSYWTEILLIKS